MKLDETLKRHGWTVIVPAAIAITTGAATWTERHGPIAVLVAFVIFVGWHALLRVDRALREPKVSNLEIALLVVVGTAGWYLILLVFPTMMIGQGPRVVPPWYFWPFPVMMALYATLHRLRRARGANPEW